MHPSPRRRGPGGLSGVGTPTRGGGAAVARPLLRRSPPAALPCLRGVERRAASAGPGAGAGEAAGGGEARPGRGPKASFPAAQAAARAGMLPALPDGDERELESSEEGCGEERRPERHGSTYHSFYSYRSCR